MDNREMKNKGASLAYWFIWWERNTHLFQLHVVDPLPLLAPVSRSPFWPKSSFSPVDPAGLIKPSSFH